MFLKGVRLVFTLTCVLYFGESAVVIKGGVGGVDFFFLHESN